MTNTEKNRLIEAFMGWELKWVADYDLNQWCFVNKHTGKTISGMYNNSELPYCTDWNWLMEALASFDSLDIPVRFNHHEHKGYVAHCDDIDHTVTLYDINDATNALCDGIKWYNSTLN